MPGKLVILSGPSGVGKDTVIDAWHVANPAVKRVIAATTRPRAKTEKEGIDYFFLSTQEFLNGAENGFFLEWKQVHGNYYGTPNYEVEEYLRDGYIAILKIDVQGALEVMEKRSDAITIFLMPPNEEELERRIRSRKRDTTEQIEKRLENAKDEMSLRSRYQHIVFNEVVNETVAELQKIVLTH